MTLKQLRYAIENWTAHDKGKKTGVMLEPIQVAIKHWAWAPSFIYLAKTGKYLKWWEVPSKYR